MGGRLLLSKCHTYFQVINLVFFKKKTWTKFVVSILKDSITVVEAHSERCQTSKRERFGKIINCF